MEKAAEFKKSVEEVENTMKKTVSTFYEFETKKLQKHKETLERAKHRQAVVAGLSTTGVNFWHWKFLFHVRG